MWPTQQVQRPWGRKGSDEVGGELSNASDLETEAQRRKRIARGHSTGHGGARWGRLLPAPRELCAGAELPV